jgi:hypothetical protein
LNGCAPMMLIQGTGVACMAKPRADPLTGQLAVTAARAALKGANHAEKS